MEESQATRRSEHSRQELVCDGETEESQNWRWGIVNLLWGQRQFGSRVSSFTWVSLFFPLSADN